MKVSATTGTRGAQVVAIPPPLYYVAGFAVGTLAQSAAAWAIGARPGSWILGATVLAAGAALSLGGVVAVVRHRTTIVPHRAVSSLVTAGVYRLSRNRMYTGLAIVYLGGALIAGSWWPLVALPGVLVLVRRLVIDPEERYLAGAFGRTYHDYQARVRRWL